MGGSIPIRRSSVEIISSFHILLVVEYLKVTSDMLLIRYHMETVLSLK